MRTHLLFGSLIATVLLSAGGLIASGRSEPQAPYRSPASVAFSPDGKTLFVAESSSKTVAFVDFRTGDVRDRVRFEAEPLPLDLSPKGLPEGADLAFSIVSADAALFPERPARPVNFRLGSVAYVSHHNTVAMLDLWDPRAFLGPIEEGIGNPRALKIAPNPQCAAITPDGRRMLITCDTLTDEDRTVCVVDGAKESVTHIRIPGGTSLRGIAVSPDGRFALVAHVQARFHLPATQVARGWVFTNVVTYLPLDPEGEPVSLPLDNPTEFFATPFDVAITPEGRTAYVSHAGADVVSVLDLSALENTAQEMMAEGKGEDYAARDLRLTRRYLSARIPVGANPRALALNPAGDRLVVANYLDDSLSVIDTASNRVIQTIPLGARERDLARRGERYFNSASLSFSGQFACASCHPDGGTDGLNWDLAADGIGNFKNTKTLLGIRGTGPFGWLGTTHSFPERFGTTLKQTFQHEPTGDELEAITAYLKQLDHSGLPPHVDPASPAALRGRALFQGRSGCAGCHRGPHLTDRRRHNVGTAGPSDLSEIFDTPSLLGVSNTPPYLHDGRARTLEAIFLEHDPSGRHGNATELQPNQRKDLMAFLRSL